MDAITAARPHVRNSLLTERILFSTNTNGYDEAALRVCSYPYPYIGDDAVAGEISAHIRMREPSTLLDKMRKVRVIRARSNKVTRLIRKANYEYNWKR